MCYLGRLELCAARHADSRDPLVEVCAPREAKRSMCERLDDKNVGLGFARAEPARHAACATTHPARFADRAD